MIKKEYESFVSEIDLIPIISQEGKTLIQAPTGGGKTYSIVNTFKALSIKNPNKIYVIACPNRSQNLQNAKKYNIFSIVGGKKILKDTHIASMVYDKAKDLKEYAIKENKEIVLVIDEAHQIIDGNGYRKKALKELLTLEDFSKNTIHLTATPNKLLEKFNYDFKYKFTPIESKFNIDNHFLIELSDNNSIAQLIEFIKRIESQGKPIIFLNDTKIIKSCAKILENENFKVGIISSETKDNNIFENLEKEEKLPTQQYDIFFSTSVIECGINLNNTDIVPINCLLKSNQLNFDGIEQKMARGRKNVEVAYTLVVGREERKIKCKKAIFKDIDFKVKKYQKDYQKIFSSMIELLGYEQALRNMESILSLDENKKLFFGSLGIEDKKIVIDEIKLINEKFKAFDRQYYYNLKELNKKLKERIKAKNFKIGKLKDFAPDILKENVEEISKEIQENKEEEKLKAKELLKSLDKTSLFLLEDFLLDNIELEDLPKEIQRKFKELIDQETILKLVKKIIKEKILIEEGIKIIIESEKDVEIKEYIKLHNYVMRNKSGTSLYINDEYGVYRKIFDEVLYKRGRVTNKKLQELLNELIDKKILKTKKSELSKANSTKLLKTLKYIYNTTNDRELPLINSLRIKI